MKTKHAFIAAHASGHAIRFMCRVLGVAHSWFHARRRAAQKRAERAAWRDRLGSEIREIFAQSKRCYGAPRIHAELKARGFRISKRTVAKLMRENGIRLPRGRRRAPITTDSRHSHAIAPNLLDRNRPSHLLLRTARHCQTNWPGAEEAIIEGSQGAR